MTTPEIPKLTGMDRDQAEQYLLDRHVPELLQALMTGLVHRRPDNYLQYLLDCLDHAHNIGADNILWDTFLDIGYDSSLTRETSLTRRESLPPLEIGYLGDLVTSGGGTKSDENETKVLLSEHRHHRKGSGNSQRIVIEDDTTEKALLDAEEKTASVYTDDQIIGEVDMNSEDDKNRNDKKHVWKSDKKKAREERRKSRKETRRAQGKINKPQHFRNEKPRQASHSDKESDEEIEVDKLNRQISKAPPIAYLERPRVMDILRGSLENLPQLPSNTVRIFLSSTFTDFKAERNILPRLAYPLVREFCAERGLDFQVVDMRWGVTDEMMNDHQVSELCLKEIRTCQQVSCGPNFVTMIGDKYGYRPYPRKLKATEFELLMSLADREGIAGREIIRSWYRINTNVVPSEYIIQPIASKLTYYNDTSEENKENRAKDHAEWNEISKKILGIFRAAAKFALKENKMTSNEVDKFFISVTEQEIKEGLLDPPHTESSVLCFRRCLQGVEDEDGTPKRWRFVDLVDNNQVDKEAKEMRINLVESKIPGRVHNEHQMKSYNLNWKGVALEESENEHYKDYLKQFSEDFVSKMIKHITDSVSQRENPTEQAYKELYNEVLQHARFAKQKCELFCGREDTMESVRSYLQDKSSDHGPMVISGKSGFGKTSVMAYATSCIQEWLIGKTVYNIIRFLGTSPQSSNVMVLLKSIIHQICALFNWNIPGDSRLSKFGETRTYFWTLLDGICDQYPDVKLVIFLDSIDQLTHSYGAYKLSWLPKVLPANIFVVVSMLSDRYSCLEHAQKRFDMATFHEIQKLSVSNGNDIIQAYLAIHKRTLTEEQHHFVLKTFELVSQPLFLKLVLDETRNWNSYDRVEELKLTESVHGAITALFEKLETTYGSVFVSRALGYLTCGFGGLSGLELEDVLSCDDDVLNEVYKYHDPPLDGTIRLPSLLWARIQDELTEYLSQRQTEGKSVMTWYHRQFREAAERRYLKELDKFQLRHRILADIFNQEDGIQRTITLKQRGMKIIENADRRITPQILNVSNLRKLVCLPFHLFHAGEKERLLEVCLINFKFLQTKLKAVGIAALLSEYQDEELVEAYKDNTEFILLGEFLELSFDSLRFDTDLLVYNIVERFESLNTTGPLIQKLVLSAKEWLSKTRVPLLLPTHPLRGLGLDSPLKFAMFAGYDGVLVSNGQTIICNRTDHKQNLHKIVTINLTAKDTLSILQTSKISPIAITKDAQNYLLIEGHSLEMREIETNDMSFKIAYTKDRYDMITPRCIVVSSNGRYVATGVRLGKPQGQSDDKTWSSFSQIAVVDLEDPSKPIYSDKFPCRKHIEKLMFVENDTKLLAIASPKICHYSLPSFDLLQEFTDVQGMYGYLIADLPERNTMVIPASHSGGIRAIIYNYQRNECVQKSNKMTLVGEDEETPYCFACVSKPDLSMAMFGIAIHTTKTRKSRLYSWDITKDSLQSTDLHGTWRTASVLCVMQNWEKAFIGYKNGDMSVFDIHSFKEMYNIHAHGGLVHNLILYEDERRLLSLSQDHFLKVWDVPQLLSQSQSTTTDTDNQKYVNSDDIDPTVPNGFTVLHPEEQCLDITATETHAISAPPFNMQCPKYWKLEDGHLDLELIRKNYKQYLDCLGENDIDIEGRTHGAVYVWNDLSVYHRKKRDVLITFVHRQQNGQETMVLREFKNTFFCLIPSNDVKMSTRSDSSDRFFILVKDGSIESLDLSFKNLSQVDIPKITDSINIESNTGKRKLIYYKIALTMDGKFFIIANPAAGKSNKYMDIIDFKNKKYLYRTKMDPRTNFKVLEDMFYFLVKRKSSPDMQVAGPQQMQTMHDAEYSCLLYTNYSFLSEDLEYGLEYIRSNGIRIWRISPLKQLHTLRGHEADLAGCAISKDNRFVVSGSLDHTVRVWSVHSGQQLCVFYVRGAVDNVMFTPNSSHVIVNCYSAPQRKRLVILKLRNLDVVDPSKECDGNQTNINKMSNEFVNQIDGDTDRNQNQIDSTGSMELNNTTEDIVVNDVAVEVGKGQTGN